ncbi:hypothetical protein XA68_17369 [Ophiocordyceps unilateralis]|uniref:Uncharacterized protein n=1 Tax=Ophiocordyceps unilateralis TaxID=268505 RepID=A0A2A9P3C6_OPHUN|nr:hypothetical protein XA68_17369 [Ophiocordyceps unilateralis]
MTITVAPSGSKSTPRSAVPKASSNAKRDGPDEQRLPAKLLEALKNPNWRQRRSSSSSSNAELPGSEMTSHDGSKGRCRYTPSSGSFESFKVEPDNINNRKISPTDRQFNTRLGSHVPTHAPSARHTQSLDERRDEDVELTGLCHVIRHGNLDASRCGSYGPQLFEMMPLNQDISAGVVHALGGLGYTMPLAVVRRLKLRSDDVPVPSNAGKDCRSGMMTMPMHVCSRSADENQKPGQTLRGAKPARTLTLGGGKQTGRDSAWERVIQKLNKSDERATTTRWSREANDSGYVTASGSEDHVAEVPATDALRHGSFLSGRRAGRVVREHTASDYSVSYAPEMVISRVAEESVIADEGVKHRHDLNPKAREFWSYQSSQSTADNETEPDGEAAAMQLPVEATAPYTPVSMPLLYPLTIAHLPEMPAPQSLQLAPLLGLANATVIDAAARAAAAAASQGPLMQQPIPAPSWPAQTASTTNFGSHSLPTRLQPLAQAVPLERPVAAPVPVPVPVPKPRVPNAWDQQAYEAYIEQRKATEPGYAMECRLRQQRRAKKANPGRVQYDATQLLMLRGKA